MNERRIHRIFEVSVLLKGAYAVIERIGGLALALATTTSIAGWISRHTQGELIEDPYHLLNPVRAWIEQTRRRHSIALRTAG